MNSNDFKALQEKTADILKRGNAQEVGEVLNDTMRQFSELLKHHESLVHSCINGTQEDTRRVLSNPDWFNPIEYPDFLHCDISAEYADGSADLAITMGDDVSEALTQLADSAGITLEEFIVEVIKLECARATVADY